MACLMSHPHDSIKLLIFNLQNTKVEYSLIQHPRFFLHISQILITYVQSYLTVAVAGELIIHIWYSIAIAVLITSLQENSVRVCARGGDEELLASESVFNFGIIVWEISWCENVEKDWQLDNYFAWVSSHSRSALESLFNMVQSQSMVMNVPSQINLSSAYLRLRLREILTNCFIFQYIVGKGEQAVIFNEASKNLIGYKCLLEVHIELLGRQNATLDDSLFHCECGQPQ